VGKKEPKGKSGNPQRAGKWNNPKDWTQGAREIVRTETAQIPPQPENKKGETRKHYLTAEQ